MADERKAITYKEVERATGGTGSRDLWEKIGMAVGAGKIPVNADGDASIDLTGASASKVERVEKMLSDAEAARDERKAAKAEAKADEVTIDERQAAAKPAAKSTKESK